MSKPALAILAALLLTAGAEGAFGLLLVAGFSELREGREAFKAATVALNQATAKMPLIVTPVPYEDLGRGKR